MNDNAKKRTNKSVGMNIRTLRHQHSWSQEDVADRLGISIPAFSKIETGVTDINLSRLEQIANVFEVSVVYLLAMDIKEAELATLQRKVILLYEELRNKTSVAV